MASSEQYGFVFAVSFIIIFSALTSTIPIDLQGQGETPDFVTPINPNLLTDFAEIEEFDKTDFGGVLYYYFQYELPDTVTTWECVFTTISAIGTDYFNVGSHALFLGIWLGQYNWVNFINENGTNYGLYVSLDDIDNDAEDGVVRYTLQYADSGNSAGGFIFYWNTTTYSNSSHAWDNDGLILVHGIGMTANTDIGNLLLALLFLQVPEVPFLVNIILISPLVVSVAYVAWFIIKSMIPFLS